MAIINQNAVAINLQANLAMRNRNVVAGLMGRGTPSLSPWRYPSPRYLETTSKREEMHDTGKGHPSSLALTSWLSEICELGCARRSLAASFSFKRASSTSRTSIGQSHLYRTPDHRDCQSYDDRDVQQGQPQQTLSGSITVRDQGK